VILRISIQCLGPVAHYEFDLEKNFHLIVGKNSVGKSYAITVVYLILKTILGWDPRGFFSAVSIDELTDDSILAEAAGELASVEYSQDLSANSAVQRAFQHILDVFFLDQLQASIEGSFESLDSLTTQYSQSELDIRIASRDCQFSIALAENRLCIRNISLTNNYLARGVKTNRSNANLRDGRFLYHNLDDPKHIKSSLIQEAYYLLSGVANEVFSHCLSIHYLPASRSGLYQALSAFGQIVAELSRSRTFIKQRIDLPNISEPVSDYFLKLSNVEVKTAQYTASPLNQVATSIEKEILNGEVEFDSRTKRMMFKPSNTNLRLDLAFASSMVSELSPIVTYLRHILTEPVKRSFVARRRQTTSKAMIIIEEPEAHLHPEVQVKLVEQFAALAALGVKVVLTSHSNFVFNKVSNLVITGALPVDFVAATLFEMKSAGSNGRALMVDQYGIDDENFVETAEALFMEKTEALTGDA